MEWSTFITWVFGLYALWYAGNILKDYLFSKRSAKAGESVHYDIGDFLDEDEEASIEVKDSDFFVAPETNGLVQEAITTPIARGSNPEIKTSSIAFDEPPAGQGVPLADFLKSFKKKAEVSSQKIQFN